MMRVLVLPCLTCRPYGALLALTPRGTPAAVVLPSCAPAHGAIPRQLHDRQGEQEKPACLCAVPASACNCTMPGFVVLDPSLQFPCVLVTSKSRSASSPPVSWHACGGARQPPHTPRARRPRTLPSPRPPPTEPAGRQDPMGPPLPQLRRHLRTERVVQLREISDRVS